MINIYLQVQVYSGFHVEFIRSAELLLLSYSFISWNLTPYPQPVLFVFRYLMEQTMKTEVKAKQKKTNLHICALINWTVFFKKSTLLE